MKNYQQRLEEEIKDRKDRGLTTAIQESKLQGYLKGKRDQVGSQVYVKGRQDITKENIKLIEDYTKIKSSTSFDLFKLFADITGFSIKELHDKLESAEKDSKEKN